MRAGGKDERTAALGQDITPHYARQIGRQIGKIRECVGTNGLQLPGDESSYSSVWREGKRSQCIIVSLAALPTLLGNLKFNKALGVDFVELALY